MEQLLLAEALQEPWSVPTNNNCLRSRLCVPPLFLSDSSNKRRRSQGATSMIVYRYNNKKKLSNQSRRCFGSTDYNVLQPYGSVVIGYDTDIGGCITSGNAAQPGDALTNSIPKSVDAIVLYQVWMLTNMAMFQKILRANVGYLVLWATYVGAWDYSSYKTPNDNNVRDFFAHSKSNGPPPSFSYFQSFVVERGFLSRWLAGELLGA